MSRINPDHPCLITEDTDLLFSFDVDLIDSVNNVAPEAGFTASLVATPWDHGADLATSSGLKYAYTIAHQGTLTMRLALTQAVTALAANLVLFDSSAPILTCNINAANDTLNFIVSGSNLCSLDISSWGAGSWHTVTCAWDFDADNWLLVADASQDSDASVKAWAAASGYIYVGSNQYGSYVLDGIIEELRVDSVIRTYNEIALLHGLNRPFENDPYGYMLAQLIRTPVDMLTLTMDACTLVFGNAPCIATGICCYNTYPTCKDTTHYALGSKIYRFTSSNVPAPFGTGECPYMQSVEYLPTEIKETITAAARIKAVLVDEEGTDIGIDPYLSTRASVQGTFWRKFLSRNKNYKNRMAAVHTGFLGIDSCFFVQKFVGRIAAVSMAKGAMTIELKDLLKALDDVELPPKLDLKLVGDMAIGDATCTLNDITGLEVATGYIRIEDEIVSYVFADAVTHILSGIVRGCFDTIPAVHSADTQVQKVQYYAPGNPFDILRLLLIDAGITDYTYVYVNNASFIDCREYPGDEPELSAVISEPTKASDLFFELVDILDCKVWTDENLEITICHNLPNKQGRIYTALTSAANILEGTLSVDYNAGSRLSRCLIYWDGDAIAEKDKPANYGRRTLAVDGEAESANEYGDVQEKKIFTRWIRTGYTEETALRNSVDNLAARYVCHRRDAHPIITVKLELKDLPIKTGDFIKVTADQLCDSSGVPRAGVKCQVIRKDVKDGRIELKAIELSDHRYLIIAPDTITSTYAAATDAEREYGCICDDAGKMSNGDPGYRIY